MVWGLNFWVGTKLKIQQQNKIEWNNKLNEQIAENPGDDAEGFLWYELTNVWHWNDTIKFEIKKKK